MLSKMAPMIIHRREYRGMKEEMDFTDSDFLLCGEDMPYGTQTADDGDPDEWIFAALEDLYHDELTGHHYFEDGQLIVIKEE